MKSPYSSKDLEFGIDNYANSVVDDEYRKLTDYNLNSETIVSNVTTDIIKLNINIDRKYGNLTGYYTYDKLNFNLSGSCNRQSENKLF